MVMLVLLSGGERVLVHPILTQTEVSPKKPKTLMHADGNNIVNRLKASRRIIYGSGWFNVS